MSREENCDELSESTDKMIKEGSDKSLNNLPDTIYEENLEKITENVISILKETESDTALKFAEGFQDAIKARKALVNSIENLEGPEEYKEEDIHIEEKAVKRSLEIVKSFQERLERKEKSYTERIEKAIYSYRQGEYYLPIFLFITVQDALMQAFCEESDELEKGDYWYNSQKKKATLQVYEEIWDLEDGEFSEKLENYIDHRNYIMHGNPDAVFSRKMSQLCLILLAVTLIPSDESYLSEF